MNTIRISNIIVGERRRQDYGNIKELAESIQEYGLLHPVVIDGANRLVAGGRRLKACQMLGMVEIPIRRLQELSEKDLRTIHRMRMAELAGQANLGFEEAEKNEEKPSNAA